MSRRQLLDIAERLTPADQHTHRRYAFSVPADCARLEIHVRYAPKHLGEPESARLAESALRAQARQLAATVGEPLAADWTAVLTGRAERVRIPNLLTVSVDDARGVYRGAGHRQAPDQRLVLGLAEASPGLVPGELPPGEWTLVLSAHTLVSPQCEVSIQIGADAPTSTP